ncbi:efflux RND transporter periplasmic adaptor subunit [uncultured Zhongshania sp.]|jgi:RND family efflux transporter MFP subunit|uniref:efflux RND transporter periplasmic adaptor subunit n=1 Tax=uncultured Zhongshania sp. TaxID=1642288 RepID=UPI0025F24633|nr:efflux RND transporter periplasmic adaptor subunit [uncultured Zhongshania sp.]
MKYSHPGFFITVYVLCHLLFGSGFVYSFDCESSEYYDSIEVGSIQDKSCFVVGERHRKRLSVPLIAESDSAISVRSKLTGFVSEIFVNEGDRVAKGDDLILIDDPMLNDSLSLAYKNLVVARGKYKKSKASFKRIASLFQNKLISKEGYEAAELEHEISLAELKTAEKHYQSSKKSNSYSLIRAPYDGLVRSVDAKVGQLAQYGAGLMVLTKIDDLVLKGWVPASFINEIVLDGPVEVDVADVPYSADVEFVSDEINTAHQSVEIKLKTTTNIVGGMSGMYGAALLRFREERQGGYLIPKQTIVFHAGMYGVFVKKEKSGVKFRWIDSGDEYGEMVEVISGLSAGDVIIF